MLAMALYKDGVAEEKACWQAKMSISGRNCRIGVKADDC